MNVEIHDAVAARASASSAVQSIGAYFLEHVTARGGPAIVPIRVELGDVIVEHLVSATVTREGAPDADGFLLAWVPKHDTLYPSFDGTLRVAARESGKCSIEIRGSYTPPLGRPGAVLDAVLGRRVAHATLLELLGRLRARAEAAYASQNA